MTITTTCAGPECDRPPRTLGMCDSHYKQSRKGALAPLRPYGRPFLEWVDTSGGCWIWLGSLQTRGYGQYHAPGSGQNGPPALAHRFSYELVNGAIPEGMQIDHLCRNRACVNPAHLEPVTAAENLRRARAHREEVAS